MSSPKRWFVLPSILLLAGGLRLSGIQFLSHHPDEQHVLSLARSLWEERRLCPSDMYYGTFALYVQASVLWLVELVRAMAGGLDTLSERDALVITRVLSAMASIGTVALVGPLVRSANGGAQGPVRPENVAPLLMAVAFLSVQCAHYGTVDSLMTLLLTASVVLTLRAYNGGSSWVYAAAGVLAGLATATKYTGCFAVLPLVLLPLVSPRRPRPWMAAAVGIPAVGLGFLVGMPCAVLRPATFLAALRYESDHYRTGGNTMFAVGPDTPWWNLELLFFTGVGPMAALLAVVGVVALARRDVRRAALFLVCPLTTLAFVSAFTTRFDRNLLPLLPFVTALAGLGAAHAWRVLAVRSRSLALGLVGAAVAAAVAHPLSRSVVFGWQLGETHPNERLQAWVSALPQGARIAIHDQGKPRPLEWYQARGYTYLIVSSHIWEPVLAHPDRYPLLALHLEELFAEAKVEATFENPWFASDFFAPHRLLNSATVNVYHGPTLKVLRLPAAP